MKLIPTFSRQPLRQALAQLSCVLALIAGAYPAHATNAVTTTEELIGAVEAFLEQAMVEYLLSHDIQGRYDITVNNLDTRLKLPLCNQSLSVRLETPSDPIGRVTTRVRCDGNSPWTVFVPAQIRLYQSIVITSRPLSRLSVISSADVSLVERDIAQLPQGYLTSLEQALGKKLTRQVNAQQALSPNHLQALSMINKGDQVVITARSGSVKVHMPGEALANGAAGEQIQVRNLRSQRVVRARVVAPGQVEVAM